MSKASHPKCRPGFRFSNTLGRCVRKKGGPGRTLRAAPDFGMVLDEKTAANIIGRAASVLNWAPMSGVNPLPKEAAGKACYLISKDAEGDLSVIGVVRAVPAGDRKAKIVSLRKFSEPRKVTLRDGATGPVVPRSKIQFHPDAKPDADKSEPGDKDETIEKILHDNVGRPIANAGAHDHTLVRIEGRTWADGKHFHIVMDPTGRLHVTDIDGDHAHNLEGEKATEEESEHIHVLGLPADMGGGFVKSKPGQGKHSQDALVFRTSRGGTHTHEFEIEIDGETVTLTTLTAEEEAMALEDGGLGDDRPPMMGLAGLLGLAEQLNDAPEAVQKAAEVVMDEITKQTDVQTVILSKERFPTLESARKWIREHGFEDKKVDEKPNTWRFRQFPPGNCKAGTFRNLRPRGTRGVLFGICVPKGNETPPGLRRDQGDDPTEKRTVAQSKVRVVKTSTGFASFIRQGDILFATDDAPKGKKGGTVLLLEKQRLGGDAMEDAPEGAKDASLIEDASGSPEKVARANMGRRVFVMRKVGGRLKEEKVLLALIDPTKAEKGECGKCGGKA